MASLAAECRGAEAAAGGGPAAVPEGPAADALTVTLTPRRDGDWGGPGAAPADVRLRRGLKELYRRFGLRAAWAEPSPCAVCPLARGPAERSKSR